MRLCAEMRTHKDGHGGIRADVCWPAAYMAHQAAVKSLDNKSRENSSRICKIFGACEPPEGLNQFAEAFAYLVQNKMRT